MRSLGWKRWWDGHPTLVSAVLCLGVFAFSLMLLRMDPHGEIREILPVNVVFAALCTLPLALRDRWPIGVLVAVTAVTSAHQALPGGEFVALPIQVAIYSVALRTDRLRGWLAGAASASWSVLMIAVAGRWDWQPQLLGVFTGAGLAVALGDAIRNRRAYVAALVERAARAERTRDEVAARRVAEERMRIARELHDVVAHQLTLINAQAAVTLHLNEASGHVAEVLAHIKDDSREALTELRAIVGLLGSGEDESDTPRAPIPGIERLDDLAKSFRRAGLAVDISTDGEPRQLPSAVNVSGYRIIQEALTNVRKHSGADEARVRLRYAPDALRITVEDDGPGGAPSGDGVGRGLLSMRERAAAVGGWISAGPGEGEGFKIDAELPLGVR
ncbi:sensor histidine kinase [Actinocorallia sp. A-T 12471]|uniref:sensor histidine kinase n=1 Tax=Actinocorallia sp. A-T 12471 TaxID=3089813 RepID=UPI0029CEDE18|nr:sensor histidine kinase [Actinocorallia sp. A-T 12471]MDX6742807.1 sensor histidine kinase [Actinocorallia sp. A-T 12471]